MHFFPLTDAKVALFRKLIILCSLSFTVPFTLLYSFFIFAMTLSIPLVYSIIGLLTVLGQLTYFLLHWLAASWGPFYLGPLKWLYWEISTHALVVYQISKQFICWKFCLVYQQLNTRCWHAWCGASVHSTDLESVFQWLPFSLPWLQADRKFFLSSEVLGRIFGNRVDFMARGATGRNDSFFIRMFKYLILSSYML